MKFREFCSKRGDTYLWIKADGPGAWRLTWIRRGWGRGEWEEEEQSRGTRTMSFLLFSSWWERVRMLLNITGAAERNWPGTVLICVREKLWHLVFQNNPGSESGACDCRGSSAQFDLRAFSELFSADPAPRRCPLALCLHPGLTSPFSELLF